MTPRPKYLSNFVWSLRFYYVDSLSLSRDYTIVACPALQILPLPNLISFSKLQFMQRFNQNFLPSSFNETWVKNSIRNIGENDIQLRNFDQLRLTHANLTSLDLFPLYNFPKIWQDFPNEQIKIIRKPSEFDAKLKGFFLDDLASNVVCNRLFCPSCSQAS